MFFCEIVNFLKEVIVMPCVIFSSFLLVFSGCVTTTTGVGVEGEVAVNLTDQLRNMSHSGRGGRISKKQVNMTFSGFGVKKFSRGLSGKVTTDTNTTNLSELSLEQKMSDLRLKVSNSVEHSNRLILKKEEITNKWRKLAIELSKLRKQRLLVIDENKFLDHLDMLLGEKQLLILQEQASLEEQKLELQAKVMETISKLSAVNSQLQAGSSDFKKDDGSIQKKSPKYLDNDLQIREYFKLISDITVLATAFSNVLERYNNLSQENNVILEQWVQTVESVIKKAHIRNSQL